ncbi:hypothetical protein MO973_43855 [Paenibacillus sp. TRM 82003]|nr:hypothetical protein [Paenibacillus sp. TRM 82003]
MQTGKKEWVRPTLEILQVKATAAEGEQRWQFVWDGDFWKRETFAMVS